MMLLVYRLKKNLGVKGSPTAVLQFGEKDGAIGYLVGEENQGLNIMFEMMNHARFSVGVQGLAVSERAYQQSKMYAFDRVQGIPIDGKKETLLLTILMFFVYPLL